MLFKSTRARTQDGLVAAEERGGEAFKGLQDGHFQIAFGFFHPRLQKEQLHGPKIITSRNQHI